MPRWDGPCFSVPAVGCPPSGAGQMGGAWSAWCSARFMRPGSSFDWHNIPLHRPAGAAGLSWLRAPDLRRHASATLPPVRPRPRRWRPVSLRAARLWLSGMLSCLTLACRCCIHVCCFKLGGCYRRVWLPLVPMVCAAVAARCCFVCLAAVLCVVACLCGVCGCQCGCVWCCRAGRGCCQRCAVPHHARRLSSGAHIGGGPLLLTHISAVHAARESPAQALSQLRSILR